MESSVQNIIWAMQHTNKCIYGKKLLYNNFENIKPKSVYSFNNTLRQSHQTSSHGYIAGIGSIVYMNIIKPMTIVSLSSVHTVLLLLYWT